MAEGNNSLIGQFDLLLTAGLVMDLDTDDTGCGR